MMYVIKQKALTRDYYYEEKGDVDCLGESFRSALKVELWEAYDLVNALNLLNKGGEYYIAPVVSK